jgi:hypothetical protein
MKLSKIFSLFFSTPLLIAPVVACAPITASQNAQTNATTLSLALTGFTTTFTQASNPTATQVMSAISR